MACRNEAFFISVSDAQIDDFILKHPNFEAKYDYTSISAMAATESYVENRGDDIVVTVLTCKNRNGGLFYE
jgi:sortase (surface protein transpeptidase)